MGLTDVIRLAKEYLSLGIFSVAMVAIVFFTGYICIYKRILNGTRRISMKTTLVSGFLLCYCVIVLGATVFSRKQLYHYEMQTQLFSTYREAWNAWSVWEWRTLVLNIMMFIPFGFCFPFISAKLQNWKIVSAFGFLFTLFIEVVQLLTGRGTFEVDDLFNNFLGSTIGYGFYKGIILSIRCVKEKKKNIKGIIRSQIPFLATLVMFFGIFTIYKCKEYGNLYENYSVKQNMKEIEVTTAQQFSKNTTLQNIYQLDILSKEETKLVAERFFENLGVAIDENNKRYFRDAGTFFSKGGEHYVCVRYEGGTISYKNLKLQKELEQGVAKFGYDVTYEEIIEALSELNLFTPSTGHMVQVGEGKYSISVKNTVEDNKMYGGIIDCICSENGEVSYVDYRILICDIYKQCEVYSEQEAYEKILEGKFNNPIEEKLFSIEVLSAYIEPVLDSKGYLQPVYIFEVKCNGSGQITKIKIPARKNEL